MPESSTTVLQRVTLQLEYPVAFTRGAFEPDNRIVVDTLARREPERRHRVAIVIDSGVAACWPQLVDDITAYAAHHGTRLELAAPPWTVPGGEAAKNERLLGELHRRFAALKIDRHSYVLAIGGGAMLDVVGYAAATLHRGVRLVRMPTTVLAQNDAGVGVKNGINAFGAKNFLGTFAAPFAVINDSRFLATLDRRDQIAGMAEAVKVALIRDGAFFHWMAEHADALARFELPEVEYSVRRCAQLHLEHIAGGGDPFEQGSARPLDFGHWAAHKLELLTDHALRHGEAVAIGMALDAQYSVEAGHLDDRDHRAILDVLVRLGLPVWHPRLRDTALVDGLAEFREHLGGELCITLLRGIGRPLEVREVRDELLVRAIDRLDRTRESLPPAA
ncbi:MAG TPA: 3-dehydroquinate synthase [Kofleriaceae bacterium]|nr:3-dehydroquinate synthase [Kofleriaceae bacterium]